MSRAKIVHPIVAEEIEAWLACLDVAFLQDPTNSVGEGAPRALSWTPDRAWGARADGRWVATLRTMPRSITVPGIETAEQAGLAVDALTNVTVAATHRRQGLLTRMLTESLANARELGEAASVLISAEWPIYGRYGYAPASETAHYTVWTRLPGSRLRWAGSGELRQVEPAELNELGPAVFSAARGRRAGNIDRPGYWWSRQLGLDGSRQPDRRAAVHIVHQGEQGPDGYLSWRSTGKWTLTGDLGQVTVDDLTATTDSAYLALWQYLLSLDVVDQVQLRDRPVDEPLSWLLEDGRAIRQAHRLDWMWLRLLDVPAALSARRYATPGTLAFEVVDTDGAGFAAGRYLLDGGPDGASCARTTRSAQLRISQRALAASYLGGHSLRQQLLSGLIEELEPGALRRADAMFGTPLAPWCATGF